MGGTPVPHEKSFVFKMHLNPFKAILDQVFFNARGTVYFMK